MSKITIFLLLIILFNISESICQVFPVNTHISGGDRNKAINIVFLSEGYQITEMDKYKQDVEKTIDYFFSSSPFSEYNNSFNIFSIEVPSNESGTDHPKTSNDCPSSSLSFYSDTYFNSTFDYSSIHRLLVVRNYSGVYFVLQDNLPDWDEVFIIVNHTMYGGSGGSFATFSMNNKSSEVAIHELGHSFANLADEYEVGDRAGREAPNTTSETQRSFIKWRLWIDETTPIPTPENDIFSDVIGLFEGAVYNAIDWYRPKLECKMRNSYKDFCEICKEQIIKKIFSSTGVFKSFYPDSSEIIIKDIQKIFINVETFNPHLSNQSIHWYIDGQRETNYNSSSLLFNSQLLGNGIHEIKVKVIHASDMVRNDPDYLLMDSIKWTIDISGVKKQIYMFQNYPNPFDQSTIFNFGLPYESNVSIKIYNILGQEIETLVNSKKQAGIHNFKWTPSLSSGIFIYRIEADSPINKDKYINTGKLVLVK